MFKGHVVNISYPVKAQQSGVKQEKHEWFDISVANTVVSPRAVVIHFVNASFAFAAVVHALDLLAATFKTLKCKSVLIFGINNLLFLY